MFHSKNRQQTSDFYPSKENWIFYSWEAKLLEDYFGFFLISFYFIIIVLQVINTSWLHIQVKIQSHITPSPWGTLIEQTFINIHIDLFMYPTPSFWGKNKCDIFGQHNLTIQLLDLHFCRSLKSRLKHSIKFWFS